MSQGFIMPSMSVLGSAWTWSTKGNLWFWLSTDHPVYAMLHLPRCTVVTLYNKVCLFMGASKVCELLYLWYISLQLYYIFKITMKIDLILISHIDISINSCIMDNNNGSFLYQLLLCLWVGIQETQIKIVTERDSGCVQDLWRWSLSLHLCKHTLW